MPWPSPPRTRPCRSTPRTLRSRRFGLATENLARQPEHVRARVRMLGGDSFGAAATEVGGGHSGRRLEPRPTSPPAMVGARPGPSATTTPTRHRRGRDRIEAISRLIAEAPAFAVQPLDARPRSPPIRASRSRPVADEAGYSSAEVAEDLAGRPARAPWRDTARDRRRSPSRLGACRRRTSSPSRPRRCTASLSIPPSYQRPTASSP